MQQQPVRSAVLRYRKTPAVLAVLYLAVLTAPWILTCVLASRRPRQSPEGSSALSQETAETQHRVLILIDVLNIVSALAALPVVYALLARAAVVFSQRTSNGKTLNAQQLFAFADRRFLSHSLPGNKTTTLSSIGAVLVLLVVVLPPIRAILVYTEPLLFPPALAKEEERKAVLYANGWKGTPVGLDPPILHVQSVPRRLAVEKTRQAVIDVFTNDWRSTAWYDGDVRLQGLYFATSLPRDTTTGMYRQHALRMNSSSSCIEITPAEFSARCPGDSSRMSHISYQNANLTVEVCVSDVTGSSRVWNETKNRQDLTEVMYLAVSSPAMIYYRNFTLQCTGSTSMGYFQLGNSFNGGRFGPLLSTFPTDKADEFTDEVDDIDLPYPPDVAGVWTMTDYGAEPDRSTADNPLPGPLAITADALFGKGSFSDLAQHITGPNDTLSEALCRLSPIPFQRVFPLTVRCDPGFVGNPGRDSPSVGRFDSYFGWANDRLFGLVWEIYRTNGSIDGVLGTGMYLANKATLEAAANDPGHWRFHSSRPNQIWRAEGIAMRTPVMSTAGLVVVSVLTGLQVLGVAALLCYIYSVPTWTGTLDALAVAGIVSQLSERGGGFLRSNQLRKPTKEELRDMDGTDCLVGVVERHQLYGSSETLTPSARASRETQADGEFMAPDYVLGVGAPGLISRRLKNGGKPSV